MIVEAEQSTRSSYGNNTYFPFGALHKLNFLLCLFITLRANLTWRGRVII